MGQLVGHDACDFLTRQHAQQAGCGGDGGMRRAATGGEGIRLRCFDNVDAWSGKSGALCERCHILGKGAQHRALGVRCQLLGALHAQHDLVCIPVGEQVHCGRDHEGNRHAGRAGHKIADAHEQGRQHR